MLKIFLLSVIFFFTENLEAQTLFPGLHGEDLRQKIIQEYTPTRVLGYNLARDKMYAVLDNKNDSVKCVYSGYKIYVPYNDPNPRDYTNAANPIINAEHTWPQSKGASDNAKSDLHHLFPTNEVVNSARGNLPFDEINDFFTDKWYYLTSVLNSKPSSNIDLYSELDNDKKFEVPEAHKGNVARAMFYFYTIYKEQADDADGSFFNIQKDALREWNALDPVDESEINRTNQITNFQGKPNPFVLDTSLIGRIYFGVTTDINERQPVSLTSFTLNQNYPNPFNPQTIISYQLKNKANVVLEIFNSSGQSIKTIVKKQQSKGFYTFTFTAETLPAGTYFYRLSANGLSRVRKMLLLK